MTRHYDVIVVGAGPAGSTAARFAALGGANTILLEKHPSIGYPLCCAEAISTSGLTRVVEVDQRWIASKIERVRLFGPMDTTLLIEHPRAGFVLERKLFDRALAEAAANAGAHVRVGVEVIDLLRGVDGRFDGVVVRQENQVAEIFGKVIIAADGIESRIAGRAGLPVLLKPAQVHSAYQYLIAASGIEDETLEFHFGNQVAPGGYIWVFCKGKGLANVGVGVCPSRTPRKKAKKYLDEFLARRFASFQVLEKMAGAVPSYIARLPLVRDNLLLVGDAGRVVDSLTGAGIANALLSGRLAGQVAAAVVAGKGKSADYESEFLKLKGRELRFYHACRRLYLKLTDNDMAAILRFAQGMFGGQRVDGINPFEVIRKIITSSPRLLTLGRHLLV